MPATNQIDLALEGLLSPEQTAAFQQEVVADPALRTEYVERLWLHSTLRAQRETLVSLVQETSAALAPAEPVVVRGWTGWVTALAACVAVAATIAAFGKGTLFQRPVATLVQAENCKWAGSDLPTAVNSRLGPGTLALVEGIATLKFRNGATVTIEAPTKLQIRDAMHCKLLEGSLVAEVPEAAHGFTIDTADMKVIDLGTKFGVTAGSAGNSQVRVFEGEVEIDRPGGGARKKLTEGKGLHVGSGNIAAGQEPSRGQQMQREDGWTAITTAFGRGKDAYARRGESSPKGLHPLLMVKHSEIPASRNNERRAVLTFDVSQFGARNVSEANLVLDPEPSGFGFSALVPDSRFTVYGITDESLDGWDEKQALWDNVPGFADEGAIESIVRRLAEFDIPRGGSGEALTIRARDIAEFIRQDTDGLVTFVIVRETGESDPSGLVHAFASKEHPTARPPLLRVK